MSSENEPAKLLLPYLQRADELQKHEPLVAYYCRLYAMERGLKIPQKERTNTTNALLVSLVKQLEKSIRISYGNDYIKLSMLRERRQSLLDKKSLQLGPDDYLHAEGFASSVFAKADKQDRAGRADLNTAKTFYAASIFFEILNQFGDLQPDLEQKQKYAAWKAADISKALKEGRKPLPGPPGGDNDLTLLSRTSSSDEYDLNPTRNDFATRPDPSRINPSTEIAPDSDSDSTPQPYVKVNFQHSTNISPQPSNNTDNYPSDKFHYAPPSNVSEHPTHPQSYHHQPYQPEHQQPYPSQNAPPSFSYPNFQSYPSFSETTLSTAPSRYPSNYQHSDASYSNLPPPNTSTYHSNAQYDSIAMNGSSVPEASAAKYECDSNYEPPPEQITEAQKAARVAVKAFDEGDIYVAFDYLKKSLELLTMPSPDHY